MNPQDLKPTVDTLSDMSDLELTVASLYSACSDTFQDEQYFWISLVQQEKRHAQYFKNIKEMVVANPTEFDIVQRLSSAPIKSMKAGILINIEAIKKGQLSLKQALFIARDIENSIIEANLSRFIKTNNPSIKAKIDEIVKDTLSHKEMISNKIGFLSGK